MIVELYSLLAAFFYTSSGVLAFSGMKDSNPTTATFISLLTNVSFLWPVTLLFSPIVFDSGAILIYALAAVFAPLAGRTLRNLSLERVGVSTTASIQGLQPLVVALLASAFLSERLPPIIYLAIIITVIGVILISRRVPASRTKEDQGKIFGRQVLVIPFSSTFCYASSNILRKQGLQIQNLPLLAASATCTFSTIYLLILLLFNGKTRQIVTTKSSIKFFILSGLVNSIAWIFSFQALQIGDASIVSTILATQPLIAIVLSYIFLKRTETITFNKTIGASLIVIGVALISILK